MTEELQDIQIERYARHLILDEIGEEGQQKLLGSKILVIGAGGIGSPALLYLAAAGVGTIHIVDDDEVDTSNLQRQVLFRQTDVGRSKASSAARTLTNLNPDPCLQIHTLRIDEANAETLLLSMDLVVDGSDNFETRALVSRVCTKLKIPLVSAAASRFDGQLAVFRPWLPERPCYACLFPEAPRGQQSCADTGIFGPAVGIAGTLAASEALKILLELPVDDQKLLLVDCLDMRFSSIKTLKRSDCDICNG